MYLYFLGMPFSCKLYTKYPTLRLLLWHGSMEAPPATAYQSHEPQYYITNIKNFPPVLILLFTQSSKNSSEWNTGKIEQLIVYAFCSQLRPILVKHCLEFAN